MLHGSINTGAIDGSVSIFKCSFEADYEEFASTTLHYWTIKKATYDHKLIKVNETSRLTEYSVTVDSDCLPSDDPCCRVTSQLKISNSSIVLNDSLITCYVELPLNDSVKINSSAHLSKLVSVHV